MANEAKNGNGRSGDGRYIDPNVGALSGEGAAQRVKHLDPHRDRSSAVWQQRAADTTTDEPTYYNQPVIKEPVWIWAVPAYFYVGGLAGAAATLGAVAQLFSKERTRSLIIHCRWLAAINGLLGTIFLIYDLGRPERFLNMLRVFRIHSPMSIGSWVLAAAGGFTLSSAVLAHAKQPLRKVGDLAAYAAALAGLPLAGYTAVLIANTVVPLWQASRKHLPFLFIGSAMTSAAAVLKLMPFTSREEKIVDSFYVTGLATEIAAELVLERSVEKVEPVGKPLKDGIGGTLLRTTKILSVAGLVLALIPGRSRPKRILEGGLGTLSSLLLRFGIFYAGKASARDPRATFRPQRQGHGAAEITGQAAVTGARNARATS